MKARRQPRGSKHFSVEQLADGVYAAIHSVGGAAIGNAGIVALGGRTLVFDSLYTPQAAADLRAVAEEVTGGPVDAVINSHWHSDHIWGNQAFDASTDIVSTEETRRLIVATRGERDYDALLAAAEENLAAARAELAAATDEAKRGELALWIDEYQGLVDAKPILRVRAPNLTFAERLTFHGSSRSAELIAFGGGHTQSDAVLFLPQERIAFMGDLLFVRCHPFLGGSDPECLLQALHHVSGLAPQVAVPGHGPVGSADSLDVMAQYVRTLNDLARGLVRAGKPEEAIGEIAIPEPYRDWLIATFFQISMHAWYRLWLNKSGDAVA